MTASAHFEALDTVVLPHDIEERGLAHGDVGAVVHWYADRDAYEVEFVNGEGETVAVLTLSPDEIRPMDRAEFLHARELVAKPAADASSPSADGRVEAPRETAYRGACGNGRPPDWSALPAPSTPGPVWQGAPGTNARPSALCSIPRSRRLMPRTTELAVCFADVCDSTSLFETHGDDRARAIVGRTLQLIGREIEDHDGTIVKSLGDGVLGTFPEVPAGAQAAVQFPQVVTNDQELASLGIQIRVGLCYGPVLREADGDVFGDAVNTASRLADWARADQVVMTGAARSALPQYLQNRTRTLGQTILRGKEEPVTIVELLGEQGQSNLTVVETAARASTGQPPNERLLRLRYEDDRHLVRQDRMWLGRGAGADLQVDDARVSRVHAYIDKHRDSFRIVDQSTNGTYVQIGSEDPLFLHHEQLLLHGTGQISLGRPLDADDAQQLHFTCALDGPDEP